jgi:colicin import membrane protein
MAELVGPVDYGRRQLIRYDKTGQPFYRWEPLQAVDFLDPQEGDEFNHGPQHEEAVRRLRRLFRFLHRYNPATLVVSNLKICWPQPGLAAPAPDLAVIPQVVEPERVRSVFEVATEATAPEFVLEVLSPHFAHFDRVDKVAIYAQAGVPEYFLFDPNPTTAPTNRLIGYALHDGRYQPLQPDDQGRLYSATNHVWLRPLAQPQLGALLELFDERTNQAVTPDATYEEPTPAAAAVAAARAQSIASQLDWLNRGE